MWNEERRVRAGLASAFSFREHYGSELEILLVDDGSTDKSPEIAATIPGIRLLREPHRGKGGALRAGLRAARAPDVLFCDLDWSVNPQETTRLLANPGELVIAVREGHGARRLGEPLFRHLIGRGFNHLVRGLILDGHEDTQCGCKLLRGPRVKELFSSLTMEGWAFDVELLVAAHAQGIAVHEHPVVWEYQPDTRLRLGLDALAMTRDLLRIRYNLQSGVYRSAHTGIQHADQSSR